MTIANGNVADADEVLQITKVEEIYTASGFDSTQTGTGTDEQSHELTAITSSNLGDANYIALNILGNSDLFVPSDGVIRANVSLKIQTKEIGGSYSDSMTYKITLQSSNSSGNDNKNILTDLRWIHTLTAGEKSNGVQVKIFSKSNVNSGGVGTHNPSFTNVQTTLEVKP